MENLMSCARGSWQRHICRRLASGDWVLNPASEANFRGKAKRYCGKYRRSWAALYDRIIATGHKLAIS